jgi:Family of unknown function (DUF6152)
MNSNFKPAEPSQRRLCLALLAAAPLTVLSSRTSQAHHGWSSFDEKAPLYLEGTVKSVRWQNPHAEFVLEVAPLKALPIDLLARPIPEQQASVDAQAVLKATRLPKANGPWEIELAPIFRMNAWKVDPIAVGSKVAVVGYTFADQKTDGSGKHILRVEYLLLGPNTYSIRSLPK